MKKKIIILSHPRNVSKVTRKYYLELVGKLKDSEWIVIILDAQITQKTFDRITHSRTSFDGFSLDANPGIYIFRRRTDEDKHAVRNYLKWSPLNETGLCIHSDHVLRNCHLWWVDGMVDKCTHAYNDSVPSLIRKGLFASGSHRKEL